MTSLLAQLLIGGALVVGGEEGYQFDWPSIVACAQRIIPALKPQADGGNSMLSSEWQEFSYQLQTTQLCRQLLAARHEGWKAATDKPDPVPVFPLILPGDMK